MSRTHQLPADWHPELGRRLLPVMVDPPTAVLAAVGPQTSVIPVFPPAPAVKPPRGGWRRYSLLIGFGLGLLLLGPWLALLGLL